MEKNVVNDFRRQKMLLKRSNAMFRRCFNRCEKSASTVSLRACKGVLILLDNTLKYNKY